MPTRLTPITSPASDVILVGDPRRSFLLAQELTEAPKMSHLARGLWGYTGGAPSGRPVTIQSTGIGGPSAATVISDLAGEGVSRIVRLGTCFALDVDLDPGSIILVTSATGEDGVTRRLTGSKAPQFPDALIKRQLEGLGLPGAISSHDLIARLETEEAKDESPEASSSEPAISTNPVANATSIARDLQTAATLALASRLGIAAAAILIVSEANDGRRLDESDLEPAFVGLGRKVLDRISPAERLFN